jgi:hypothetical protein
MKAHKLDFQRREGRGLRAQISEPRRHCILSELGSQMGQAPKKINKNSLFVSHKA